jgi:hypothetical protein
VFGTSKNTLDTWSTCHFAELISITQKIVQDMVDIIQMIYACRLATVPQKLPQRIPVVSSALTIDRTVQLQRKKEQSKRKCAKMNV